jgi:CBS domain-containing protein
MFKEKLCKAKDIMTADVVTVKRQTPIYDAIRAIVENNITGLPVVNDNMTIAGVISEKDMLRLLYNFEVLKGQTVAGKVDNFMTPDVITCDHEDDLVAVCNCLIDNHFRRLPVLADGKLVGVITRADIIRYILELAEQ